MLITQDFYSHSNWVELGNRGPYMDLLRPDLPIGSVAGTWSIGYDALLKYSFTCSNTVGKS